MVYKKMEGGKDGETRSAGGGRRVPSPLNGRETHLLPTRGGGGDQEDAFLSQGGGISPAPEDGGERAGGGALPSRRGAEGMRKVPSSRGVMDGRKEKGPFIPRVD